MLAFAMWPWNADPQLAAIAPLRDVSLAKVVRQDILDLIPRGDLAPGRSINEPDVALRLGVSRVPVREALRELEATELVVSRGNVGVFVRELAPGAVADLYELLAVLDSHAGAKAAALAEAPRRGLSRLLEASIAAMRKASRRRDGAAYYAENLRFHWAIVEAAGNAKLSEAYRGVVQQLHLWRLKNLAQPVGMAASIREHEAIAKADPAADPANAGRLLADHVSADHGRLDQHLSKEKPTRSPRWRSAPMRSTRRSPRRPCSSGSLGRRSSPCRCRRSSSGSSCATTSPAGRSSPASTSSWSTPSDPSSGR